MNKEDVLSKAMKLLTVSQNKTAVEANQTELVYMMGYNDGVLDLTQEVLDLLTKENDLLTKENAGEDLNPTAVPQDAEKWEEAITKWLKVFKDLGFIGDKLFDMMKPRVSEITGMVIKEKER